MAPMILCNIAWMLRYRGRTAYDTPIGGGRHPDKEEVHNFDPFDGEMYGYVPAIGRTINVARIGPVRGGATCPGTSGVGCCNTRTDGVDVVWTATSPNRGRVLVGWYRNATVFRHLQGYERGSYQIKARAVDCHLLPVQERKTNIELARVRGPGHPGHSPVWFAESDYAAKLRRSLLRLVARAQRQIFDRYDLETRAGLLEPGRRPPQGTKRPWRDQRQVDVVARDPEVHAWILKNSGGRCEMCGAAAPFLRPGGSPYLEIHHVDRLADGGADIPDNAVALCPNCHREAHYGVCTEVIREALRKRIANRSS